MTINLLSQQHSIYHTQVEWDAMASIISQFAFFESNKKKLTNQLYQSDAEALAIELTKISLYDRHFQYDYRSIWKQVIIKLPSDQSLARYLTHLEKDGILNFAELNKLVILIEAGFIISQDFPNLILEEFKSLLNVNHSHIQKHFSKEFRHLVDLDGEIHFEKHPDLAEFNQRLKDTEGRIRKIVHEWIHDPQHTKVLQFQSYDIHFDRYVVPVRSDSYRSDIGTIITRSETGQTLFVEPFEVREICNKRLEIMAKIDEIINQLNLKFSRKLRAHIPEIRRILESFLVIDFYTAKIEFAEKFSLHCPTLRSEPGFQFNELFHPLIKNPIKNNVKCESKNKGIVISGPNTGGKTVFLKSISIAYLLLSHGFFVPAKQAEMYLYDGLFYFGNDLQDLKTGLSSFSGEVKNYIELMENILPSNLILIDEIFNSTSSDEASALSMAYFDELHKKSICHIVVSTHHQMFKTLIHQDEDYLSCHVGFDTVGMKPTYKIIWGTPGASMAIDIFSILSSKNNFVRDIPQKALMHLNDKHVSYETLLQKVTQKQVELDKLLHSNKKLESDLKNQKGAMEGVLQLKLNDELARAQKEIEKILNEAKALCNEVQKKQITKIKKIEDKGYQLKSKISSLNKNHENQQDINLYGDLEFDEIMIGDRVFSNVLKKEFVVQSKDSRKKEVLIGKGPIKITVPFNTLSRSSRGNQVVDVKVSFQKSTDSAVELDARGLRLSEFQTQVDRALGDLLAGDIPYLTIIHGHGEGILKNWLRKYIYSSSQFIIQNGEQGNDGTTTIVIG